MNTSSNQSTIIHPTASIDGTAAVGQGAWIGPNVQIDENAQIGAECRIHKNAYIGAGVKVGDRSKIQTGASLFDGVELGDGVFVGPHACFTNDKTPRAINLDGSLKRSVDWQVTKTFVGKGASIGANATIVCGIRIGAWAMVGAGAVVSKDVPEYGLVLGNPAQLAGFVCRCGHRLAGHACAQCGTSPV